MTTNNLTNHTPGPWHLVTGAAVQIGRRARYILACVNSDFELSREDANLIAAAPELLAALEAAIDCGMVPKSSVADGGANKHSRQVQVADLIRAAIAKAKGVA